MLQRPLFKRAALLAPPLVLTTASLIALIIMSVGVDNCGYPDFTPFYTLLFLFSLGFVWLSSELMQLALPRLVAMPLAIGLYFAIGRIGLEIARTLAPFRDAIDESEWLPFWLEGLFIEIVVLPGSC